MDSDRRGEDKTTEAILQLRAVGAVSNRANYVPVETSIATLLNFRSPGDAFCRPGNTVLV